MKRNDGTYSLRKQKGFRWRTCPIPPVATPVEAVPARAAAACTQREREREQQQEREREGKMTEELFGVQYTILWTVTKRDALQTVATLESISDALRGKQNETKQTVSESSRIGKRCEEHRTVRTPNQPTNGTNQWNQPMEPTNGTNHRRRRENNYNTPK